MKTLLTASFATNASLAPTLARIALAVVIFPHGAQKVLGWWGGFGFGPTMDFFQNVLHIPAPLALLALAAEFLAPLALILGLLTRLSALGIAITMAVAASVNLPNGFFMNWFGNQKGEGIEFFILAIGLAAVSIIQGAGRFAVDSILAQRLGQTDKLQPAPAAVELSAATAR